MSRTATCVPKKAPGVLTDSSALSWSGVASRKGSGIWMPALLTVTSTPPNSRAVSTTARPMPAFVFG